MAQTSKTRADKGKTRRSQLGRPSDGEREEVRGALLDAARRHFLKREFKAVSVREIAAAAGVNGAMVSYYFGGKQGLYQAMVDELLDRLEAALAELGAGQQPTIADFSASYSRLLAANPWWPNFIVREVLYGEEAMRDLVLERFTSLFAPRLMQALQKEMASGEFRADLDPRLTLISLMGLTVFPFLARPLLESVLQFDLDAVGPEALAAHNTALFLHGVQTRATGES